jgi:hypothetical protein
MDSPSPSLEPLPNLEVGDYHVANSILNHLEKKFESLQTEEEPYQHFYMENIWPDDVYSQMLQLLPAQDLYRPLNIRQWVNADGVSTRDKCYFAETIDKMEPEAAAFWTQIAIALTSRRLRNLLFNCFKRDVALRLGVKEDEVVDAESWVTFGLTRDFQDYKLKPHTDGYPRVVTAQFYLPKDESQRDLGTSIYVQNPILQRLYKGRFTTVKRMEFLPNSGYAFAVNNHPSRTSYHGRETIGEGSGERNTILVAWKCVARSSKSSEDLSSWPLNDLI